MTLQFMTEFLGWSLVINFGALIVFFVLITAFKEATSRINVKLFGVSEGVAKDTVFKLFHCYRILVFFFNGIPFIVCLILS